MYDNYVILSTEYDVAYNIANVYDTNFYKYSLDNDSCSLMSINDVSNMLAYRISENTYTYYEIENSKLYKRTAVLNDIATFVLTEDISIDDSKTYYFKDGSSYSVVEEPDEGDIGSYYERKVFYLNSSLIYDAEADYYTLVFDGDEKMATKEESPDTDKLLNYYLIFNDTAESTSEEILTFDFSKFNKNPIAGVTLTDVDFNNAHIAEINGVKYLLTMHDFLYTLEGQLIMVPNTSTPFHNFASWVTFKFGVLYTSGSNGHMNFTDDNFYAIHDFVHELNGEIYTYETINSALIINFDTVNYIVKVTKYSIIEGKNQKYNNSDLTFKFSGDLDKLTKVTLNGTELDSEDYTATSGSTIITLKKDYLDTLKSGTYTLKVEYSDGGYTNVAFTAGEENPQTFDGIIAYAALGILSLTGVAGTIVYTKRKRLN